MTADPEPSETNEMTEPTAPTDDIVTAAATTQLPETSDPAGVVATSVAATTEETTSEDTTASDTTSDDGTSEPAPAKFVQVEVVNVAFELPSPSPTINLRELELPYRVVHFPIGLPEAQAIALALEGERSLRPTTAELLASVLQASGSDVVAVRLTGTSEGTILAELDLMTPRGHVVLDCRPTDGIALALRQPAPAPILCEASMLDA